jgi:hypothetical protein
MTSVTSRCSRNCWVFRGRFHEDIDGLVEFVLCTVQEAIRVQFLAFLKAHPGFHDGEPYFVDERLIRKRCCDRCRSHFRARRLR